MTMLVDVRTPGEYSGGHIEGAVNIPVENIMAGDLGVLAGVPKDTPVEAYCRSGARSGHACAVLQSMGFSDVTNLGSMQAAVQRSSGIR